MKMKGMKNLWIAAFCAAAAAAVTGCASTAEAETTAVITQGTAQETLPETPPEGENRPERPQDDGSILAKITAIDGSTITVVTADESDGQRGRGGRPEDAAEGESLAEGETRPERPERGTRPEKPADGETPPETLAEGETPPEKPAEGETPPEMPAEGESMPQDADGRKEMMPRGGQKGMRDMEFSEETVSWTISSDIVIRKGAEESASVSDLAEGDIIRAVLDGETVVSIDIMDFKGGQEKARPQEKQQ